MISSSDVLFSNNVNERCGTKAQCLKILNDADINIPIFYAIPSGILDNYCINNGIPTIVQFYANSQYDEDVLTAFDIAPDPIIDESIFENGVYMVRSSSIPDNNVDKSEFPSIISGAFESYLATDVSEISICIKKVWRSAYEKKAFLQCKSFSNKSVVTGLGVIIQKMIKPVFSGVAHILEKDVKINWTDGHLSKIVKGETIGNNISIYISDTAQYILRGKEENILDIINGNKKAVFCDLADILFIIKDILGGNQEIEWLYDGKEIWIVQAQELLPDIL